MNIRERIPALRALMEERGYDVYMVPNDDFHQSEYVGDHFKVREYITGFKGLPPELLSSQRMKQASGLTQDILLG